MEQDKKVVVTAKCPVCKSSELMVDLKELQKEIDNLLDNETDESLFTWYIHKKFPNYKNVLGEGVYNQLLQESNSIITNLQSDNLKMREGLEKISQYHYPESIFPPVTDQEWKDIHAMLQEKFNMPIDRLTGAYARLLMKANIEIAKEALK